MTTPPINCEEALRLLALFLDGELGTSDENNVSHHLERCRSCYSRAEFERQLKSQLASLGSGPVPPGFEERIRNLISSFDLS